MILILLTEKKYPGLMQLSKTKRKKGRGKNSVYRFESVRSVVKLTFLKQENFHRQCLGELTKMSKAKTKTINFRVFFQCVLNV